MKIITSVGCMMVLLVLLGPGYAGENLEFKIHGGTSARENRFSLSQLEAVAEVQVIPSSYFDRALNYKGSRLHVVSFSKLLSRFRPATEVNAVLLNCFDDYQGIISLDDIRRYDLRLATRIEIGRQFKRPDWLNPLMIIVPDSSQAPFQERFVTANIREIKFVRLEDYYAPLQNIVLAVPEVEPGFQVFKDNCLFCHELKGIGGGKGVRLLKSYHFSGKQERFQSGFSAFHKNGVAQFVSGDEVGQIGRFLKAASSLD